MGKHNRPISGLGARDSLGFPTHFILSYPNSTQWQPVCKYQPSLWVATETYHNLYCLNQFGLPDFETTFTTFHPKWGSNSRATDIISRVGFAETLLNYYSRVFCILQDRLRFEVSLLTKVLLESARAFPPLGFPLRVLHKTVVNLTIEKTVEDSLVENFAMRKFMEKMAPAANFSTQGEIVYFRPLWFKKVF